MKSLDELSEKYKFSTGVLSCLRTVYGEGLEKVLESLKIPGDKYYFRVNTLKATRDEIMTRFREKGIEVLEDHLIDEGLYLHVSGPFEITLQNKKIVVDKYTAESVMLGANVYAPGVVKCSGIRFGDKVTVTDPCGQPVASGEAGMGEREILSLRRGLAVETKYSIYRVPSLRETEEFENGLIYLQSRPSILTSKILDARPGETIVDMTCSPGGKLSHICQLMSNQGRIIAVDRNERKISITRGTLNRLGCKNVELLAQDGRYFHLDFPRVEADRCIVDPPCSALGVLPKLYDFSSEEKFQSLTKYQRQFLKAASEIVKKDGIVVYSVCTITLEECEEVTEFALEKCGLELDRQNLFIGSCGFTLSKARARFRLLQRFHPHKHGVGYFIARFRKK